MPANFLERAEKHRECVAFASVAGDLSYGDLLDRARRVAAHLQGGRGDLREERVAFLLAPGADWAAIELGIWQAGGVAVPLCLMHPREELEYVVRDAVARQVVVEPGLCDRLEPLARDIGVKLWLSTAVLADPLPGGAAIESSMPSPESDRRAMIIYTSGTTGKPKGVVSSHANVRAQVETLVGAWGWRQEDRTLLVLPLHHVHGIVNVVGCAMWSGATVEIPASTSSAAVWNAIGSGRISVFMAVPTIYYRLVAEWDAADAPTQAAWSAAASNLRLMVSGSAALPVPVLERWKEITGHTLLERYGMTEIGMALSNPLEGERRPGFVGQPLPGVDVRLVDEHGVQVEPGESGEIEVSGASVFNEYWRRPEATSSAFRGGWFRTGDIALAEEGSYRILGRSSVDIIKTGGYKVSALEIEEVLRTHPAVADCAVVAIPDQEWGERVAAAVVPTPEGRITLEELRAWGKSKMAVYKVPSVLAVMRDLPRNPLGKVTKPDLVRHFTLPSP